MNRPAVYLLGLTVLFFLRPVHGQTKDRMAQQAPAPAHMGVVSDLDGTELLRLCNKSDTSMELQFCEAFILGVRDGVVLATGLRDAKPIIETPVEAKQEQLKAVVVKYLNDHPEEHHKPAALLVVFALSQAFRPQEKAAK
jgi:hypothetical protein